MHQLVLAALISCTAPARSDATSLGALWLQPLSVTGSDETLPAHLDMLSSLVPLLVENNEQQLPPFTPVRFLSLSADPTRQTSRQSSNRWIPRNTRVVNRWHPSRKRPRGSLHFSERWPSCARCKRNSAPGSCAQFGDRRQRSLAIAPSASRVACVVPAAAGRTISARK